MDINVQGFSNSLFLTPYDFNEFPTLDNRAYIIFYENKDFMNKKD